MYMCVINILVAINYECGSCCSLQKFIAAVSQHFLGHFVGHNSSYYRTPVSRDSIAACQRHHECSHSRGRESNYVIIVTTASNAAVFLPDVRRGCR